MPEATPNITPNITPNTTAITSFDKNSVAYDQLRPDFPQSMVADLLRDLGAMAAAGVQILELGAGTGKFTRNLVAAGLGNLIVVEPSEGMLEQCRKNFPGVDCRSGSSYALPVADESIDVIFVAQAFHWFADEGALKEMSRVLKPRGRLACLWNYDYPSQLQRMSHATTPYTVRGDAALEPQVSAAMAALAPGPQVPYLVGTEIFETEAPWLLEIRKVISTIDTVVPQYRHENWRKVLEEYEGQYFMPLAKEGFFFRLDRIDRYQVYPYWETRSYITAMLTEGKQKVKEAIMRVVEQHVDKARDMWDETGIKRVMGTHYIVTQKA